VQAFISSRLDYCNALLYGVSDGLMRRLQSVQNAAARRRDHITPILRQLHWLPVRQRVTFKIAVLVFHLPVSDWAGTGVSVKTHLFGVWDRRAL